MTADLAVAQTRLDDLLGEQRLMIAEADDQERLVREIAAQLFGERLVVAAAELLPAQILVDEVAFDPGVAEVVPIGNQIRPPAIVPCL